MLIKYFVLMITVVNGYSFKTHRYLGDLTDKYLSKYEPETYDKIINILDDNIQSVSTWADSIKRTQKYIWTKPLHYIDILECRKNYTKEIVDKYCENKCIYSMIENITNILKDKSENIYKLSKVELLKFLIHFIQDFNQPMHLLGYTRGGNDLKIIVNHHNRNKTTNLHYIWDSLVPEYYISNFNYNFDKKIKSKDILKILNENIKISCNNYPILNYIIFENYFNKNNVEILFENYMILIINTLLEIYKV